MAREPDLHTQDYAALAEVRYQIRRFLQFSQLAAHQEGLEPQQHQLMLTVRSRAESDGPTIRDVADQLLIRHHSAVGLVDRLSKHGLVDRVRNARNRREVRLRLTPLGEEKLKRLSVSHRAELRSSGPGLVDALGKLLRRVSADESETRMEEKIGTDSKRTN